MSLDSFSCVFGRFLVTGVQSSKTPQKVVNKKSMSEAFCKTINKNSMLVSPRFFVLSRFWVFLKERGSNARCSFYKNSMSKQNNKKKLRVGAPETSQRASDRR
jgi:hypothetical protein